MSSDELFDVCDADDRVIGTAPRSEVHARQLLHRAVHIWVFDPVGRLLIHLRSAEKDEYPLCYTSSASGHLGSGESYEVAAHRELEEELGLAGELQWVTKLPAGPETSFEHTVLYTLVTDRLPNPDPREIAAIEYHTAQELEELVQSRPEAFTPPFLTLWAWWRSSGRQPPTL